MNQSYSVLSPTGGFINYRSEIAFSRSHTHTHTQKCTRCQTDFPRNKVRISKTCSTQEETTPWTCALQSVFLPFLLPFTSLPFSFHPPSSLPLSLSSFLFLIDYDRLTMMELTSITRVFRMCSPSFRFYTSKHLEEDIQIT